MINKVTNTHCRSKIIFFLLTLCKSLKNFLLGTSNAIFFTSALFNGYRRRSGKWSFGARPVGKMNTKFCFFMSRCCKFFCNLGFLSETSQRLILLTESTLKSWRARVTLARFKMSPIFGQYVCFLDEFLQETRLSVILTETRVAYWRWASKVF